MLVAALFRLNGIPGDLLELRLAGFPGGIEQADPAARNHGNFMFVEKKNRSRVRQHGRNIRCDESLAIDAAHNERRAFADRDDLFGIVGGENGESEETLEFLERRKNGFLEISLEILFDQMRDDFGVGLRCELVSFRDETALQRQVVLNDAVVRNDDAAFAIAMRMRVFFGRTAMSRPARVTESELTGNRFLLEQIFKILQLARTPNDLQLAVLDNGDSRRVIAAIFERLESAHDDGNRIARSYVSEYSAHVWQNSTRSVEPRLGRRWGSTGDERPIEADPNRLWACRLCRAPHDNVSAGHPSECRFRSMS